MRVVSTDRPARMQRPAGQESGDEDDGRQMRRRPRRKQADTAVLISNVPKTVRISEFKAKVRGLLIAVDVTLVLHCSAIGLIIIKALILSSVSYDCIVHIAE